MRVVNQARAGGQSLKQRASVLQLATVPLHVLHSAQTQALSCKAFQTSPARLAAHRAAPVPASQRAGIVTCATGSSTSSSTPLDKPVVIVGAGIAGLAVAVALSKVGVPVRVIERGPSLRQEGAAIGLWANAWRALDALGVADELRRDTLQLNRVDLCRDRGELLRSFGFDECDGGAGQEFRGVRRGALLDALARALPSHDMITFGATVQSITGGPNGAGPVRVTVSKGQQQQEVVEASVVVGADGAKSFVAGHLGLPPARYSGYVAARGVAVFPEGLPAGYPRDTIRQIWGEGTRAGLYPLSDTELYWYTCTNAPEGSMSPASAAERHTAALAMARGWAWQVEDAICNTPVEDITFGRIVDRWTAGAFGAGRVTLAGDAAHPMTPNLGQGGCTALEDAVLLARLLTGPLRAAAGGGSDPVAVALRQYEVERSKRCLPLTVRANIMGALLQLPNPAVCLVRDTFVRTAFSPSHFLDHTAFDCGNLPVA